MYNFLDKEILQKKTYGTLIFDYATRDINKILQHVFELNFVRFYRCNNYFIQRISKPNCTTFYTKKYCTKKCMAVESSIILLEN